MENRFIYLLILTIFISCPDSRLSNNELNYFEEVTIKSQNFKSQKASDLNDDALNFLKNGYQFRANKILLKALKIERENPVILNNLGLICKHQKKYKESIFYFQNSLKVSDSTYLMAGANLSLVYNYIGENQKGIEIADYVIEKSDHKTISAGARIHKAFCLIDLGQCENARTELKIIRNYSTEVKNLQKQIDIILLRIIKCGKNIY